VLRACASSMRATIADVTPACSQGGCSSRGGSGLDDLGLDAPHDDFDAGASPHKSMSVHEADQAGGAANDDAPLPEWGLPPMEYRPLSSGTPSRSQPGSADQDPDAPQHDFDVDMEQQDAPLSPEPEPEGMLSPDGDPPADVADVVASKRKRRRRQPTANGKKKKLTKLYRDPERTTIPSDQYRDAIANGDYSADRPPLAQAAAIAAHNPPPKVTDADGFDDLVHWRKIPLFDNVAAEVRARVVALGCGVLYKGAQAGAHAHMPGQIMSD
jgi:hypothetical protein